MHTPNAPSTHSKRTSHSVEWCRIPIIAAWHSDERSAAKRPTTTTAATNIGGCKAHVTCWSVGTTRSARTLCNACVRNKSETVKHPMHRTSSSGSLARPSFECARYMLESFGRLSVLRPPSSRGMMKWSQRSCFVLVFERAMMMGRRRRRRQFARCTN